MDERKKLRIAYGTASERKAGILFSALSKRYESVWLVYEHGKRFGFKVSENGVESETIYQIPPLARYPGLIYQHGLSSWRFLAEDAKRPFDLVISEGIQLTLALGVLRKAGFLKQLVYYAQDWFPNDLRSQRFDRICCWGADQIWNLTGDIQKARQDCSPAKLKKPSIIMDSLYGPVPLHPDAREQHTPEICYLGGLRRQAGLELSIRAIYTLRQRGKQVQLHLVGKPEDEAYHYSLVNLCKELGVTDQVIFHGFVPNDKMSMLVQSSLAGLALFPGGKSNYSNFGVIGKVREYLENGVPVIVSKASAMAADLESAGAAFPVADSAGEIAYAVELLLDDPGRRKRMQESAYAYACKKSDPGPYYQAIEAAIASSA